MKGWARGGDDLEEMKVKKVCIGKRTIMARHKATKKDQLKKGKKETHAKIQLNQGRS